MTRYGEALFCLLHSCSQFIMLFSFKLNNSPVSSNVLSSSWSHMSISCAQHLGLSLLRGSVNIIWILEIYMECKSHMGGWLPFWYKLSWNYLNSIRVSVCCAAEGNRKCISGPVKAVLNSFIIFSNCIGCKEWTMQVVQWWAAKRQSQKSLQKNSFPFLCDHHSGPCAHRDKQELIIIPKGVAEYGKETNTHFFFFRGLLDPTTPYLSNRVCFSHTYVFFKKFQKI